MVVKGSRSRRRLGRKKLESLHSLALRAYVHVYRASVADMLYSVFFNIF